MNLHVLDIGAVVFSLVVVGGWILFMHWYLKPHRVTAKHVKYQIDHAMQAVDAAFETAAAYMEQAATENRKRWSEWFD